MEIYTYQDAIDNVIDVFGADRGSTPKRIALRAVQRVYGKFPDLHRWSYYERDAGFTTVPSQSDGTIEYDHTGGATAERQVTLTGSTWPDVDDFRIYKIISDQVQYNIEDRKSSTVLTLTSQKNPGEDLDAGTSYTLVKSKYLLPTNFRKMSSGLWDLRQSEFLTECSPAELLEYQRGYWQAADPDKYAIQNGGEYYGGWLVELAPPPAIAETWEYVYEAAPRPLRTEREATNTITTNGTTSVVGSGTKFSSKHVGCILRVPISGTTPPGGIVGSIDEGGNTVEPFDEQRVIVSVETTEALTVDAAISARAGVGYTISDPLDMEPGSMVHAFLALCESEFAKMNNRKDWREWNQTAKESLIEAMGADNRQREAGDGMGRGDRLAAFAIPESYSNLPKLPY